MARTSRCVKIFLCCTIILLAGISPVFAAYDTNTTLRVTEKGYAANDFTLKYIGAEAVQNVNISQESWELIDTFYTKYHDILPFRWSGMHEPNASLSQAYIMRVLPDGSTISYCDYGHDDNRSAIEERARKWEVSTLATASTCSVSGECDDIKAGYFPGNPIADYTITKDYPPYGKLGIRSIASWASSDYYASSDSDYFFFENIATTQPGDSLRREGATDFDPGWYSNRLDFTQYYDRDGVYPHLPGVGCHEYQPQTPLTPDQTLTFPMTVSELLRLTGISSGDSGDKLSIMPIGNSYIHWVEQFGDNSEAAKLGYSLNTGMNTHARKNKVRTGTTYTLVYNKINADEAFKKWSWWCWDKEPKGGDFGSYITAKWQDGGVGSPGFIHTNEPDETKLVVCNVGLSSSDGAYKMTGDVTNAGNTNVKSVVISTSAPVIPVSPYPNYTVGALQPDDFSSFELTFSTNDLSKVPVELHWIDEKGNPASSITTFDLRNVSVRH